MRSIHFEDAVGRIYAGLDCGINDPRHRIVRSICLEESRGSIAHSINSI